MNRILDALRRATAESVPTDGQLVEAYAARRDGAAFAELVRRHGPMVWGVCRRLLSNRQDAEDAFQATFLVLVRKPGSIRPADRVGGWLHGVAVRAARKAGKAVARRRERQVESLPEPATVGEGIWHDLVPLLDQEVGRLPEKYRLPVILCDLEGHTRREAAARLGWPEGTVAGRLAEARALLARRLARHGLPVSGGVVAAGLSGRQARAAMPDAIVQATIQAATGGALPPAAAAIAEGVIRAMSVTRRMTLAAILIAAAVGGLALRAQPSPRGHSQDPAPPPPAKAQEPAVNVAWGKEVDGLQAGVGFAPGHQGPYRVGETATLVVLLRNVSNREMTIEYSDGYLVEHPPAVVDAAGKPVKVSQLPSLGGLWRRLRHTFAAGEVMELGQARWTLEPAGPTEPGKPTVFAGPGRYRLSYAGVPPHTGPAPQLTTGQLEVDVVAGMLTPVFGQKEWRFSGTYRNTTPAPVDLPTLLQQSSVVLDGKEYPRQILKFGGGSKLRPGESWSFTVAATEYLPRDAALDEGKHKLTLKFGGQEFGPVEFEWRK